MSSLHQLKEENVDLRDSVGRSMQRRDHLLAVRARLMALNNLTVNSVSVASSEKGQKEPSGEAGSNGVDVSSQAHPLKVKLTSKSISNRKTF